MNSPKYSIIVPIYNAEKYLTCCLDSILNQTEQDFEIIAVNDGSTDRSAELLNSYKDNPKIKILSEPNSGASSARNLGLRHASGKWLTFIDADDWFDPTALASFSAALQASPEIDFIISDRLENHPIFQSGFHNGKLSYSYLELVEGIIDPDGISRKCRKNFHIFRQVAGQLYRADIIKSNSLSFPNNIVTLEDGIFNISYLQHCQNIFFYSPPFYHYRDATESVTHQLNPNQLSHSRHILSAIKKYLQSSNLETPHFGNLVFNNYRNLLNSLSTLRAPNPIKTLHSFDHEYHSYLTGTSIAKNYLSFTNRIVLVFLKLRLFRLLYCAFFIKNSRRRHDLTK